MPGLFSRVDVVFKAIRQLGPLQVTQAGLYRLGLSSGYWRWKTPPPSPEAGSEEISLSPLVHLPDSALLENLTAASGPDIIAEAEEICSGNIRLFGGPAIPFDLSPKYTPLHWTYYETHRSSYGTDDPKLTWEPARFGWAIALARAFAITKNESYADIFWRLTEDFIRANPPYSGPHWVSGQEVAMRIIALAFSSAIFDSCPSSSPDRKSLLAISLAAHAARIPPTLIYARSQNNNHLLSEAAGLITAGALLSGSPKAENWFLSGWNIFNRAVQRQIAKDGVYIQHSTNYHRLMLQTALWVQFVGSSCGKELPRPTLERLASATRWLLDMLDPSTGQVPNLGHNDGSYLLPLASGGFNDYRPVIQAASRGFLGMPALPPGPWDEMSLWFGLTENLIMTPQTQNPAPSFLQSGVDSLGSKLQSRKRKNKSQKIKPILREENSWASLRAVHYDERPGQCDQLQVELWWKGQNLALDAGTYSYNASAPWENALANTNVHNTVQVDGQEQMQKSGRFLWLEWAQANYIATESDGHRISAEHSGYDRLGVRHRRTLSYPGTNHWQVLDSLIPLHASPEHHSAVLHWLLPDLPWELHGTTLRLKTDNGILSLRLALADHTTAQTYVQLVRAGQVVAGPGKASPILGWYSPTYNIKQPALSLRFIIEGVLPLSFSSDWFLP